MISGRDFIVFGLQPWDFERGSNCKNIAMELAKNNRVLYVNRPMERSSFFKFRKDPKIQNRLNSIKKGIDVLRKNEDHVWVFNPRVVLESINWMPEGRFYHAINKINAKRFAGQIKWAMNELQFSNPILFIDNDFLKGFYLNEFLNTDIFVYYIRDFLLSQPYFAKHGNKMEPQLMAKADVVVANSLYLAGYGKKFNQHSYDIGQGCELEGFIQKEYAVPEDMKPIGHPVIGYCGALLQSRLDIELIADIAKQKKEWNIVLIGPEDEAFKTSSLHNMSNVIFLGSKPMETLPAYIHCFDVCINPQSVNQMTIGNYPRKIDEYLAAGKPVVATDTEAMQLFKDHCVLAKNATEYIAAIEKFIEAGEDAERSEKRKNFALSHTWEASVNSLYDAIEAYSK